MNYIYILIVSLFTVVLVAQMMAFAASSKKAKAIARRQHKNQPR